MRERQRPGGSAEISVALPPEIRARVEELARELSLDRFGRVSIEFTLDKGHLAGTFLKLGPIKNQELEELALALRPMSQTSSS